MVHAGGTNKSHSVAAESVNELAEWNILPTRVAELTAQTGREMKEEQTERVEAFHQREATRPLPQPREVSERAPQNPPQVGVVEMDGGRIRTRDEQAQRGVTRPHWREFQAGCVVRLQSEASAEDPRPELPKIFGIRPKVHKLVAQVHRQRNAPQQEDPAAESIGEMLAEEKLVENATTNASAASESESSASDSRSQRKKRDRPVRLMRTCVATLEGADACGRILAAEAADRGMDQAERKAFVGDGQSSIWKVWKRYFKRQEYVPIVDFIHLLTYVYHLAMAVGRDVDDGWRRYLQWITDLWQGRAAEVLAAWEQLAEEHGVPPDALPDNDPRRPIQRGVTYLTNNLERVDYPRYRRLGLPVTSTLMESLVKEFNLRVKGTEKFWNDPGGAEAILTVRAAVLSEDDRFNHHFATRPGCRYHRRTTLKTEQARTATTAP